PAGLPADPRSPLSVPSLQVVAAITFLCFAASQAPGAYTALAAMEVAITLLFFFLYLLRLDQKLSFLFWPLADVFNSAIAVLFLLVVCIFAVVVKTNNGTLAGGVFGLVLLVLCVADVVLLSLKISFGERRQTNTPAT
ncbi:CKLF factor, partial [Turnix velox]|nr:CKLF factor [Turnix velox]